MSSLKETWRQRSLAAVWHLCTPMKLHAPEAAALPLRALRRAAATTSALPA